MVWNFSKAEKSTHKTKRKENVPIERERERNERPKRRPKVLQKEKGKRKKEKGKRKKEKRKKEKRFVLCDCGVWPSTLLQEVHVQECRLHPGIRNEDSRSTPKRLQWTTRIKDVFDAKNKAWKAEMWVTKADVKCSILAFLLLFGVWKQEWYAKRQKKKRGRAKRIRILHTTKTRTWRHAQKGQKREELPIPDVGWLLSMFRFKETRVWIE